MKWKTMLITIVLNIFILLAVTMLLEYINLAERFISIEDTIQEVLDSSIDSSVGSEELFSSEYQQKMTSFGSTKANDTTEVRTLLWVDSEEKFYKVNTYLLAYYYGQHGKLPQSNGDINILNSYGGSGVLNGQTGFIYEWLYGEQKSDYNNSLLTWANRSPSRRAEYSSVSAGSRNDTVNSRFKEYYTKVGVHQRTVGYLKQQDVDSFSLAVKSYPTLMNMGFKFMSSVPGLSEDYTKTGSNVTHDNFTSTFHVGKSLNSQAHTFYYLTPRSLGVTYIPVEVLKPTFITNLDTVARLNYIGGASTSGHVGDNVKDASHCVETDVYTSGGSTHKQHTPSSTSEDIVTDGLVEFDLSTVQVKVDYFYVNFNSSATPQSDREIIISKVNGAVQSYAGNNALKDMEDARPDTLTAFRSGDNDTGLYTENFNGMDMQGEYADTRLGRIIARVSVRVKVHIPYQSSMLQWMCEKFSPNNHHYDIKLWDAGAGKSDVSSDGIWYQYTTYYYTSRS